MAKKSRKLHVWFGSNFGFLDTEMDDLYDSKGVVRNTWAASKGDRTSCVIVDGWGALRWIIERGGLICFQVTAHINCGTCDARVDFVKQRLADQKVPCFWTSDEYFLYVTVGPRPPGTSPEAYLSSLLGLRVLNYPIDEPRVRKKRRQTKGGSRCRRAVQKSKSFVH